MLSKHILRYAKNNPQMGYFLLSKIFGVNVEYILYVLDIKYDEIKKCHDVSYHEISYQNNLIYREYSDFSWIILSYDSNNNLSSEIDSYDNIKVYFTNS